MYTVAVVKKNYNKIRLLLIYNEYKKLASVQYSFK